MVDGSLGWERRFPSLSLTVWCSMVHCVCCVGITEIGHQSNCLTQRWRNRLHIGVQVHDLGQECPQLRTARTLDCHSLSTCNLPSKYVPPLELAVVPECLWSAVHLLYDCSTSLVQLTWNHAVVRSRLVGLLFLWELLFPFQESFP